MVNSLWTRLWTCRKTDYVIMMMSLITVTIRVDIYGQKFCGQLADRCFFVSMLEIPLKLRFVHIVHIFFHKKTRIWLL